MPLHTSHGRCWYGVTPRGLLAAGLLLPLAAQAARPLATEDAGVLAASECEVEAFVGRARADASELIQGAQLACGTALDSQLTLAHVRAREDGEPQTRALVVGLKTALPWLAAGPVEWAVAMNAGRERSVSGGESELTASVNLAASAKLTEDFTAHANLGWVNSRPARVNTTTWAVAGELAVTAHVDATAEVFGDDRQRPWAAAGLRLNLGPRCAFSVSHGVQQSTPRARLTAVGARWSF